MEVNLAKKIYPIEYLSIAKAEFADELSIETKESLADGYTISINALSDETKINSLTGIFLNRFLEISIVERFG